MKMPHFDVRYTVVASGFQASDAVEMRAADLFGVWVPIVDSCQITLRGSFDQTSANFVPLTNSAGSGDWTFGVGPGSRAVTLQDAIFPFPFLKFFTSVAQTAPRSLAVITKLRLR